MKRFERIGRQRLAWDARARTAQDTAAPAFERLLKLAEGTDSGQGRSVVRFLACTFGRELRPFDVFEFRAVDVPTSDDMLACLDALRWGRAELYSLVPNGEARVLAALKGWGVAWPDEAA